MALDYSVTLGALLPDLDSGSQRWQSSSSFSDLDIEMTQSGTASWVGCEVLLEDAEDEEFSSKRLSQEFDLSQPVATIDAFKTFDPLTHSPASALPHSQQAISQGCTPTTSAATSLGSLHSEQCADDAITSAAMHSSSPLNGSTGATASALAPGAGSRAGTPVPDLAPAPVAALDCSDTDAVRIAGLALQLTQGNVNSAMAHLLTWAAAK